MNRGTGAIRRRPAFRQHQREGAMESVAGARRVDHLDLGCSNVSAVAGFTPAVAVGAKRHPGMPHAMRKELAGLGLL